MISPYEIVFKLLLGTLLGGIIGFERQTHGRPAGFRTQLLVCVSCVLLMIISESYYYAGSASPALLRVDPTRIAAGAMTGVGFLGAGVILKTGVSIQGLTTAACIWIVSAIGLAIGSGQYLAGIIGFVITFLSLWLLRILEVRMPRLTYRYINLLTEYGGNEEQVRQLFIKQGFEIIKTNYSIDLMNKEKTLSFTISIKEDMPMKGIIDELTSLDFVKRLEITS